ncbi:uncharacterized protein RSE6_02803 [Rhynchosporium secalis]|uniref:BTB domain-containing protein n=1 Tax=Rhynchosporium secalis TaxID=38038 RepID=A0A1E1M160_RHYSE|nr:uncharacterized protein RSE6_02803 [Rhynchosporium secalis]
MASQAIFGAASFATAAPAISIEKPARPPVPAPKPKLNARLANPESLVTLIAGEGEMMKKFVMHKDFACHYSPVFKAAFNSSFLEGQTQVYKLPKTSERVVNLLVHWLYTQEVIVDSETKSTASSEMPNYCELWILADRLLIPRLQNAVVAEIIELQDAFGFTALNCLIYVYANTAAKSPLRTMLLHRCMCLNNPEWFSSYPDGFPKEMLLEMAVVCCNPKSHALLIRQTGIRSNPGQYNVAEDSEA